KLMPATAPDTADVRELRVVVTASQIQSTTSAIPITSTTSSTLFSTSTTSSPLMLQPSQSTTVSQPANNLSQQLGSVIAVTVAAVAALSLIVSTRRGKKPKARKEKTK